MVSAVHSDTSAAATSIGGSLSSAARSQSHLWLADLFQTLRCQSMHTAPTDAIDWSALKQAAPSWVAHAEKSLRGSGSAPVTLMALLLWLVHESLETNIELLVQALLPMLHPRHAMSNQTTAAATPSAGAFARTRHRATWTLLSALFDSVTLPNVNGVRLLSGSLLVHMLRDVFAIDEKHMPPLLASIIQQRGSLTKDELYLWWSAFGSFEYRRHCSLRGKATSCGSFLWLYHFQIRLQKELRADARDDTLMHVTLPAFMAVFTHFYSQNVAWQKHVEKAFARRQEQSGSKTLPWSDLLIMLSREMPALFAKTMQYIPPVHSQPASTAATPSRSRSTSVVAPTSPTAVTHPSHTDAFPDLLVKFVEDEAAYTKILLNVAAATHDRIRRHVHGESSLSFDSFLAELFQTTPTDDVPSPLRVLNVIHTLRFVPIFFLEQREWSMSLREFAASFGHALETRVAEFHYSPKSAKPRRVRLGSVSSASNLSPLAHSNAIHAYHRLETSHAHGNRSSNNNSPMNGRSRSASTIVPSTRSTPSMNAPAPALAFHPHLDELQRATEQLRREVERDQAAAYALSRVTFDSSVPGSTSNSLAGTGYLATGVSGDTEMAFPATPVDRLLPAMILSVSKTWTTPAATSAQSTNPNEQVLNSIAPASNAVPPRTGAPTPTDQRRSQPHSPRFSATGTASNSASVSPSNSKRPSTATSPTNSIRRSGPTSPATASRPLTAKTNARLHDSTPERLDATTLGPGHHTLPQSTFGNGRGARMDGTPRGLPLSPATSSFSSPPPKFTTPPPGAYDVPSIFGTPKPLPGRKQYTLGQPTPPRNEHDFAPVNPTALKGATITGRPPENDFTRQAMPNTTPGPGAYDLPSTLSPTPVALVVSRQPEVPRPSHLDTPGPIYTLPDMATQNAREGKGPTFLGRNEPIGVVDSAAAVASPRATSRSPTRR